MELADWSGPDRCAGDRATLLSVALLALATIAVGARVNLIYGALGRSPWWNLAAGVFFWIIANQLLYFLMAFGFGMVLLSTPAALAIYDIVALLLPFMVYGPIFGIVSWGPDVVPWLDLGLAVSPLLASGPDAPEITGKAYAQVAVTSFVWVVSPMVLRPWRVRRSEIGAQPTPDQARLYFEMVHGPARLTTDRLAWRDRQDR